MFNKKSYNELVNENEELKRQLEHERLCYKHELYTNEMWRETILIASLNDVIDFKAQNKIYKIHNGFMNTIREDVLTD